MVVGAAKTLQSIPSRGRISVMRIQNFTVKRRHTVVKAAYGSLLIVISILMAAINPITLFTNWFIQMTPGSFLFNMWAAPPYDIISEVWVYNYTNVKEYLDGTDSKLKMAEVGPFRFLEIRTNENMTIDKEKGVMTLRPKLTLKFLRDQSVADIKDVSVVVPNIALIAISTLAADKLGYIPNAGAYYAIKAIDPNLFKTMTVEKLFWGYHDPLVSIANTFLPGWIDFGKLGVLDRFYAQRNETAVIELKNETMKYSLKTWNGLAGLPEQGFTTLNTSIPCNRIQGTYEGIMVAPNYPKGKEIPIFKRQACRVYPFTYQDEIVGENGFTHYRYLMDKTSFSKSSPYACNCTRKCFPEGFIDVSKCYYGFPILLSKTHFLDVDPVQQSYFEGMNPDPEKDGSLLEIEPTIGVPVKLKSNIQVNIAVRTSAGNPITKPLKDKIMPLVVLSMIIDSPPSNVLFLLRLRFVIAPPLVITIEVVMFLAGAILTAQGVHRIIKPKYKLIENEKPEKNEPIRRKSLDRKRSFERRKSSVILNAADNFLFRNQDDLAKEAVSLLAINEDDDLPDLVISD